MSTVAFQGFGNDREIGPETRLECKICWWVYDPGVGDPVWQIAPGVPVIPVSGDRQIHHLAAGFFI